MNECLFIHKNNVGRYLLCKQRIYKYIDIKHNNILLKTKELYILNA